MNKSIKQIKFHELMLAKAQIEMEFWKTEMLFHEDKIRKIKNMEEKFTA